MFGRGLTRLQLVYVGDVAQAIAGVLERTDRRAVTFELGGPHIYSYEELLRAVAREAGVEARPASKPGWCGCRLLSDMH
jgi:nucleoside-diphosphate-sugar epimerase